MRRHLGAAQATGHLDLHALGAGAHRAGERTLHRATEGHSVLELLGDRLRHQLGVELGALDLEDVDLDLLVGHAVQVTAQRVHFGARLADHDAGRAVWMLTSSSLASLRIVISERPACDEPVR